MKTIRTITLTCLLLTGLMFVTGCGKCPMFGGGNSDKTEMKQCARQGKCGKAKSSCGCRRHGAKKRAKCRMAKDSATSMPSK